jgi:anaerobic magnesium-protoporphyrin IX monomethyl ester cyclase
MKSRCDIVLINPGNRRQVFQNLGDDVAAIEPPFLVAVMAAWLRERGFRTAIIDANAENITPDEVAARVRGFAPLLTAVIVYGSQPSASTQNMTNAALICRAISDGTDARTALGGLHPSALPERTLREESVDFVIQGEGFQTLEGLLSALSTGTSGFSAIPGLWYREAGAIRHSHLAPVIDDLDLLPAAAWDLLPMQLYRAHNWHCFDDIGHRSPYGAIYTSLGCPYNCVFCCINAPFGKPGIRYRSPQRVVEEIDLLVERYGIRNLKIVDELFVLYEPHYMGIVDLLIERGYNLNIWAYARVDTVKQEHLPKMKQAGINWLALGIESANPDIRDSASKRLRVQNVKQVVQTIQSANIRVIGNYIFGLPDETLSTMRETLDMAMELNCEFANFYSAMAYPGSKLYDIAVQSGWQLPTSWHGYSQHSYECLPLATKHVSAAEVLKFRDDAFHTYFANPVFLGMIEEKFGWNIREHVERITVNRLKRKLCP